MQVDFRGQYWHNFDQKSRLFIPSKFREMLGESFTISMPISGEKCLYLYPTEEWLALVNRIKETASGAKLTTIQRLIYMNSDDVEQDKQGRITVKQNFCEFAGLDKEVFIMGAGSRIEIWNRENFDAMLENARAEGLFNLEDLSY